MTLFLVEEDCNIVRQPFSAGERADRRRQMIENTQQYIIPLLGGSDKVEAPILKNRSVQLAFR